MSSAQSDSDEPHSVRMSVFGGGGGGPPAVARAAVLASPSPVVARYKATSTRYAVYSRAMWSGVLFGEAHLASDGWSLPRTVFGRSGQSVSRVRSQDSRTLRAQRERVVCAGSVFRPSALYCVFRAPSASWGRRAPRRHNLSTARGRVGLALQRVCRPGL
jgi:hypothetical protein